MFIDLATNGQLIDNCAFSIYAPNVDHGSVRGDKLFIRFYELAIIAPRANCISSVLREREREARRQVSFIYPLPEIAVSKTNDQDVSFSRVSRYSRKEPATTQTFTPRTRIAHRESEIDDRVCTRARSCLRQMYPKAACISRGELRGWISRVSQYVRTCAHTRVYTWRRGGSGNEVYFIASH